MSGHMAQRAWCLGLPGLVGVVAACNPTPTAEANPTASAPPRVGLYEGDARLAHGPALAVGTEGESAWRVTIPTGSGGVSCASLLEAYPERPEGADYALDFWLRRPIEPGGEAGPWDIRSCYAYDEDGRGRGLVTRGALLADVDASAETLKLRDLELAVQDRMRHLLYTGDLEVKICGRKPRAEAERPQPELRLTIDGTVIEVRGASIRPVGNKKHLRLTRAPHACGSAFTEGYDFYLDVAIDPAGDEGPRVAFAALQGDVFPGDPSGSRGKETFALSADGDLGGTGEVTLSLEGTLDLSGHAVALKGKVNALRCTPAAPARPAATSG
ncbi:MAG: hypothetical protein AAGN82_30410 [Myxococcota bacterium]